MYFTLIIFFCLVCLNPKSAKILIFDLPHLPTKEIESLVEHCPTLDELIVTAEKYDEFIVIIAFASNRLPELTSLLNKPSIDALYILNVGEKIDGSVDPWWNKTTIVYNEKQLMRHLCTKSMLCYFNEGLEHRKNENFGLANACMLDSLRALDYSAQFI